MTKKFFWGIFFSVTFLQGCVVVDFERDPFKLTCHPGGIEDCQIRSNILICNKENTHCEYIDVPILQEDH